MPDNEEYERGRHDEWRRSMGEWREETDRRLREEFVPRHEFTPIQRLVYGVVGVMLTAVVVALVMLVVRPQ